MENTTSSEERDGRSVFTRSQHTKNKLNIICRGFVKVNKVGGEIISVVPDVPIAAYLDDLLFIVTIPNEDQSYAPAYIRLQDKSNVAPGKDNDEVQQFTEVHSVGYVKQKKGEIIVCAPRTHVWVELNKIVFIATIPSEGKDRAPCYIKPKVYKFESRPAVSDEGEDVVLDDEDFPNERSLDS